MCWFIKSARATTLSMVVLALLLAACGGSGLGSASSADCTQPSGTDQNGCTYVSFTDAPGDFLTYTVNVTNLVLTRSDNTTVSLLPAATTVDFAQYNSLDEFLTLASMPVGTYVSGSITLDYSNADIEVQDQNGNALKVSPVDQNGAAITTLTLSIKLDTQNPLVLVPGVPRLFQVDFNLDASNTVNLTNSTVTVQPFLVADVDPNLNNQIQVRGPLTSVDTAKGDFTLGLRPFYAGSGNYGDLRVFTSASTTYDINQIGYAGNGGLAALATAGATTAVIAKGSFDFTSHEFFATEVDAGSSVPGGTLDVAEGVVLSRSGDNIVLRGATLYRAGQTVTFHDSVAATVGANTKVREAGDPTGSFSITDISVGQRLLIFGTLTNTNPASLALDASSGFARLQYTKFDGLVTTAPAPGGGLSMTVNAQNIEGRPVSLFNFAGTGTSSGTDANPASYQVSLPNLLSTINTGDPVRVWGFVTPFGSAPPDFNGTTVADYVNANALLAMAWPSPGSANAFASIGASGGIVLNLGSTPTPLVAKLEQGGVVTPLASLTNAPTVQATTGVFAIAQNGSVQVHLTLAGFISDLNTRLSGGAKLRGFFARGGFAGSTSILTANGIAAVVQ